MGRAALGRLSSFQSKEKVMEDVLWVAVTIAFFVIAIGYVHFCDRVK
jgi:hypothetical protein